MYFFSLSTIPFGFKGCSRVMTPENHVAFNHTYAMPVESPRTPRNKLKTNKRSEEEQLTRDEKRARNLNIPISVDDIINLPMDEFNERLSKYDLSESQLTLIRDIRRRGKNKVCTNILCKKKKIKTRKTVNPTTNNIFIVF